MKLLLTFQELKLFLPVLLDLLLANQLVLDGLLEVCDSFSHRVSEGAHGINSPLHLLQNLPLILSKLLTRLLTK